MATLEQLVGDVVDDVVFRGVVATGPDHAVVVAVLRSREVEMEDHTFFLIYEAGEWRQHMIRVVTSSVCIEAPNLVYALTPHGFVVRLTDQGYDSEAIDPSEAHFNSLRNATEIILRGGLLYVTGMGRELFRGRYRQAQGHGWAPLLGPEITRAQAGGLGFLSAELDAEGTVHAVGFDGEMGYLQGDAWREICSPTNMRLTRIRRSHGELLLACGSAGVLLRGRRDSWGVVEHGVEDNFWDLAHFDSTSYVASTTGLYTVNADYEVEGVEFILDNELSAGWLSASPGALWSVGQASIARYAEGQWTQFWPPPPPPDPDDPEPESKPA